MYLLVMGCYICYGSSMGPEVTRLQQQQQQEQQVVSPVSTCFTRFPRFPFRHLRPSEAELPASQMSLVPQAPLPSPARAGLGQNLLTLTLGISWEVDGSWAFAQTHTLAQKHLLGLFVLKPLQFWHSKVEHGPLFVPDWYFRFDIFETSNLGWAVLEPRSSFNLKPSNVEALVDKPCVALGCRGTFQGSVWDVWGQYGLYIYICLYKSHRNEHAEDPPKDLDDDLFFSWWKEICS
jgi:hypothetical protein